MSRRPLPRLIPTLALLAFALPALAQDEKPWLRPDPLVAADLEKIEAARDRATRAKTQLAAGELAAAAETLRLPAPPEGGAVEEWRKAAESRAEALGDLLRAAGERIQARAGDEIRAELAAARAELYSLTRELELDPGIDTASRVLADYRGETARAEQALADARALLESRKEKLAALTAQAPGWPARLDELRKQLETIEPEAGDVLGAYRRETIAVRIRALGERIAFAPDARRIWSMLVDLRVAQVARAQAAVDLARKQEEAARASEILKARNELQAARDRVVAATAALETAEDPIRKFRLETEIRVAEALAASRRHYLENTERVRPKLAEQEPINESLEESWEALKKRFESDRAASSRTPEILRSNLKRVEQNRTTLQRRLVPDLERELSDALTLRAEVQDQLLEIAPRLEERPTGYLLLEREVGAGGVEEAKAAWVESTTALRAALREQDAELGRLISSYEALSAVYSERGEIMDRIYAFVLARIYWVRNEEPLGLDTLSGIRDEVARIGLAYTGSELRQGVAASYRQGTWKFILLAILVVALLAASAVTVRRLRSFRKRWSYPGGPILVALQRTGVSLLLSALAPAALALAAVLLGILDLPPLLAEPGRVLLFGLALAEFARRFLWNVFREDGIARTEFKASDAVADQLHRASRWTTFGFVAFALPVWVTQSTPDSLRLVHIPRVFHTVMLAFFAVVLLGLLRRRGALMSAVTGQTGFWYRILFFLEPLLALGFLGIVLMDVLGYRFGAALLTMNVLQTFLWGLLLIGFYNLMTTVVEQSANRVRTRKRKEVSAREARKESEAVFAQLSRLAGVTLVVTTVVVLARFWGILDGLESFLSGVPLPKFTHVSLWDLIAAVLWIGAGHFVIRHLPALYEVIIFPRLENTEPGTRYVIVTVSKYVVFLIAYSSALLTLKFSFTSLGVVLAAVSVGIGFGLQEIVANFISGLILFFERPVRVGDIVTVGNTVGTVEQINIRATQVMNFDRQVMIIPNRQFIVGEVTNWTHNDLVVRGSVDVGVAYGTDVERVKEIILGIAREHPKVKKDPEPRFLFLNFGDSSLNLRCWIFTDISDRLLTISEINTSITKRFAEEGVVIPFPQRDVHFKPNGEEPPAPAAEED